MAHSTIIDALQDVLANTYALFLKTQQYHWHVTGPNFRSLHLLFEEHYRELLEAVDSLAERIVTLGGRAPATFKELAARCSLADGQSDIASQAMVADLACDHKKLLECLIQAIEVAQDQGDEGSIALLSERIAAHEKQAWMLRASLG